jgi:hypothetical protein
MGRFSEVRSETMHPRRFSWSFAFGLVVFGSALGASPPPDRRYKLVLQAPPVASVNSVIISPDGSRVAIAADEGWVRRLTVDNPRTAFTVRVRPAR